MKDLLTAAKLSPRQKHILKALCDDKKSVSDDEFERRTEFKGKPGCAKRRSANNDVRNVSKKILDAAEAGKGSPESRAMVLSWRPHKDRRAGHPEWFRVLTKHTSDALENGHWEVRDEIKAALGELYWPNKSSEKKPNKQSNQLDLLGRTEEADRTSSASVEPRNPVAIPSPVVGNEARAGESLDHGQDAAEENDPSPGQTDGDPDGKGGEFILPPLDSVNPTAATGLMPGRPKGNGAAKSGAHGGGRRSKYPKPIGDRGEEIVEKHLRAILTPEEAETIKWLAKPIRRTPGWDIEYQSAGQTVAVEVKSTVVRSFLSIELTANEWKAAEEKGVNYRLALVADVDGKSPRVGFLNDPFKRVADGEASVEPAVFKFEMRTPEG